LPIWVKRNALDVDRARFSVDRITPPHPIRNQLTSCALQRVDSFTWYARYAVYRLSRLVGFLIAPHASLQPCDTVRSLAA
jgi:hypothetical protein